MGSEKGGLRLRRVAGHLALVLYTVIIILLALALIHGDWTAAALAAGILIADYLGIRYSFAVMFACAIFGEFWLVGLSIALVVAFRIPLLDEIVRTSRPKCPSEVADAVGELPHPLLNKIREQAQGALITSVVLLEIAANDSGRWSGKLGGHPGQDAFDGPVVDSEIGQITQYAAESISLAVVLAAQLNRKLDSDVLGTAATLIPLSAASEWSGPHSELYEAILHASDPQVLNALLVFIKTPAGGDVVRRTELVQLFERSFAADEPREEMASWSPIKLRLVLTTSYVIGFIWVVLKLPWEFLKWAADAVKKSPERLTSIPTTRAARKRERSTRDWGAWNDWPRDSRILWLLVKPVLGPAAVLATLIVTGASPLKAMAVAAIALFRPVRYSALGYVLAALVAPVSWAASAILFARAVLTTYVLWRLGRTVPKKGGIGAGKERVREARIASFSRFMSLPLHGVDEAKLAYEKLDKHDDDEALDAAASWMTAAVAEVRPREVFRAVKTIYDGLLFGRWDQSLNSAAGFAHVRRLMVLDVAYGVTLKFVGAALTALAAVLLDISVTGRLGITFLPPNLVLVVCGALLALSLLQRPFSWLLAMVGGVSTYLVIGPSSWKLIAVAGAIAAVANAVLGSSSKKLMVGRRRWRAWPIPKWASPSERMRWRAANDAIEEGRTSMGIELLTGIADDALAAGGRRRKIIARAALGRAALLYIDRGQMGVAEAMLDRLPEIDVADAGAVAQALVAASVGDYPLSERLLTETIPKLDSSSPLAVRARSCLAEVYVQSGAPDRAVRLLSENPLQLLAVRGLAAALEDEVLQSAALAGFGYSKLAADRLEDLDDLYEVLTDAEMIAEDRFMQQINDVEIRRNLLMAQLAIVERKRDKAIPRIEQVRSMLGGERDDAFAGQAELLHGVAIMHLGNTARAVREIEKGAADVERRRRQLRVSERRSSMLVAGDEMYALALDALVHADRVSNDRAGEVAAGIVESLRRSAISESLRSGEIQLDSEWGEVAELIEAGDRTDKDVRELRVELTEEVSKRFAQAYLPTPAFAPKSQAPRGHHTLAYYFPPRRMSGWRVWIAPDGSTSVDEVSPNESMISRLERTAAGEGFADDLIHLPISACVAEWEAFGVQLLPPGLREALSAASREQPESLVIVPDGVLSMIPWAALHVGGEPLCASAAIQLLPGFEFVGASRAPSDKRSGRVLVTVDEDSPEWDAFGSHVTRVSALSSEAFMSQLGDERPDGAYLTAHGLEDGLRQRIEFRDGSGLSAATALTKRWPSLVVFASCLVGRVEHVAGKEPLGLAISCMLGGADSVISSVVEITEPGAVETCPAVMASVTSGAHPALALRAAQLGYLENHSLATPAACLGLVCVSTVPPYLPEALSDPATQFSDETSSFGTSPPPRPA